MFTRKISLLSMIGLLPLVLLTGLFYQLHNSRPARVSAAPANTQGLELRWEDDFESYTPGSTYTTGFPFSNYIHSGLKDMFVYTDTFVSPDQSLKGHGIIDGCGGSIAYRSLEGGSPVEIEVWVRNGTGIQPLTGCHDFYGAIELSTAPSWTGDHRGLLAFTYSEDSNGNPQHRIFGGAVELNEPYPGETRLFLQNYQLATWYKVKVRYEILDNDNVQLTYWVDNQQKGQQVLGIRSFEEQLAYVGFFVGERVAWFDNAAVYSADSAPNLGITKEAYPVMVPPGGSVTYDLQITNYGPFDNATGVQVVDTLPAGVIYQSATASQGTCQHNAGIVTCGLGSMAVNATANVQIVVQAPNVLGQITNVATVSGDVPDPYGGNNTAQVVVTVTDSVRQIYLPVIRKTSTP